MVVCQRKAGKLAGGGLVVGQYPTQAEGERRSGDLHLFGHDRRHEGCGRQPFLGRHQRQGETTYNRYDKVGWGSPIRRNAYVADARWYSNTPNLVVSVKGEEATELIPKIEQAIQSYPYSKPGAYRIWPGPNSNTFVAHVLRSVPELGAVLPPDAVGRDYLPEGRLFSIDADGLDMHATLYGLLGISAGARSGLEVHFMGLVAGVDVLHPAVKIPALGRFGV